MNKQKLLANLALLTAALVWGFAFVQQEQAAKYVGSFTVNALRSIVAVVALFPLIVFTISSQPTCVTAPASAVDFTRNVNTKM